MRGSRSISGLEVGTRYVDTERTSRETCHTKGGSQANKVMSLSENLGLSSGRRSNRRIIIPVEIPSVSIVHTVKIRLLPADGSGQSSVALAAVGQILAGALEIKHTRRWDTANVREVPPPEEDESRHFSYEVQANPDSWLVAGRRKGHFRAKVCQAPRQDLARSDARLAGE